MITIKRVPKEVETYVVWLIPESVGDVASEGVRGAVRAEPEDLRAIAPRPAVEWTEAEMLRHVVREVEAALTEAGVVACGTLADRVRRMREVRDNRATEHRLRAELARARDALAEVDTELTSAGMASHGTPAERVLRLANQAQALRALMKSEGV